MVRRKGIRPSSSKRKKKYRGRNLSVFMNSNKHSLSAYCVPGIVTDGFHMSSELQPQLAAADNPNYLIGMVLTFGQVISP